MKTFMLKPKDLKPKWYLIDASDKILGRLATRIATILMGKHKPEYTPNLICGDFVVVINADKVKLTGKKTEQKFYQRYSGFPSGRKIIPFKIMLQKKPTEIIRHAVKGMLPKTKLHKDTINRLKIYAQASHPHHAQKPEEIILK